MESPDVSSKLSELMQAICTLTENLSDMSRRQSELHQSVTACLDVLKRPKEEGVEHSPRYPHRSAPADPTGEPLAGVEPHSPLTLWRGPPPEPTESSRHVSAFKKAGLSLALLPRRKSCYTGAAETATAPLGGGDLLSADHHHSKCLSDFNLTKPTPSFGLNLQPIAASPETCGGHSPRNLPTQFELQAEKSPRSRSSLSPGDLAPSHRSLESKDVPKKLSARLQLHPSGSVESIQHQRRESRLCSVSDLQQHLQRLKQSREYQMNLRAQNFNLSLHSLTPLISRLTPFERLTRFCVRIHRTTTRPRQALHFLLFILILLEFFEVTVMSLACDETQTDATTPFLSALVMATVLQGLEILLNFGSPVFHEGVLLDEETDLPFLRSHYLRHWFPFDLIVTIPWDLFALLAASQSFAHLQCQPPMTAYPYTWVHWLRALKIFRLPTLFRLQNPLQAIPKTVKTLHLISTGMFCLHCVACLGLALASDPELGIRSTTTSNWRYWRALLWATTSLMYGVFPEPVSWAALHLNWVSCVVGYALTLTLSALMAAFFVNSDPFESISRDRSRRLDFVLKSNAIPWSIQKSVHAIYPALTKLSIRDYRDVLSELPSFLTLTLQRYIVARLIRQLPIFSGLDPLCCEALALVSTSHTIPPQRPVIQRADEATELHIVSHGIVELRQPEAEGEEEQWVANLKDGSWFGETALLRDYRWPFSVWSVTSCDLFKIHRDDFYHVVDVFPEIYSQLGLSPLRKYATPHTPDESLEESIHVIGGASTGFVLPRAEESGHGSDSSRHSNGSLCSVLSHGSFVMERPLAHQPGALVRTSSLAPLPATPKPRDVKEKPQGSRNSLDELVTE
eukprot:NODE_218_length_2658_cov_46.449625_g203_i0.p1 GENE.NODE_218_length_2658_cov_46.449625_g203_i0~~NODE_218_length_2658_cov_46.449625_g203_i0.p1  ORF type:complete len:852 (+),score=158.99 NODE_218_length_2658_cov_46.449625_g203_i0:17-2572(+)